MVSKATGRANGDERKEVDGRGVVDGRGEIDGRVKVDGREEVAEAGRTCGRELFARAAKETPLLTGLWEVRCVPALEEWLSRVCNGVCERA